MRRHLVLVTSVALLALSSASTAQNNVQSFTPVTQEMLVNPSPDDWLMYSRTYDAQRFSPLKQITRQNVGQLKEVFKKELGDGTAGEHPDRLSRRDVSAAAGRRRAGARRDDRRADLGAQAADGRQRPRRSRSTRTWCTTPRPTASSWRSTRAPARCAGKRRRAGCYLRRDRRRGQGAHRAHLRAAARELLHRGARRERRARRCGVLHRPAADEPGGETWGGAPGATRLASTWGLPGGYDPVRRLVYLGRGEPDAQHARRPARRQRATRFRRSSPADLYSNSTIALNPDTGKLAWYYQHLPGDDWDEDYPHERTLVRTAVSPDPKFVKWINPDVQRGEQRDIAVMVGEGGGILALDRTTGQFLWATPVPVRHARTSSSRTSTARRDRRISTRTCCSRRPASAGRSATGTRGATGRRRITRPQLALRALHRELPRHDDGGSRNRRAAGDRAPRRHPAPRQRSPRSGPGWRRSTCRPGRSSRSTRDVRRATAPCWRRRAIWCSGATSIGSSAPSTRRAGRCSGRRRSAAPFRTARSPTR